MRKSAQKDILETIAWKFVPVTENQILCAILLMVVYVKLAGEERIAMSRYMRLVQPRKMV